MKIRIGTRGSRLALAQTNTVITALKKLNPAIDAEIVIIKTKGDLILDISLDKIGDKGLFVAEIEEQLRLGQIDIAIHSMKDLPTQKSHHFTVIPVLKRADHRDVLVTKHNILSLQDLPPDSVIGSGSKRRKAQLESLFPSIKIVAIRGNIESRIKKMTKQNMDGTILAAAGVQRLGLKDTAEYKIIPLSILEVIPAPAQGVLACQIMNNNKTVLSLVKQLIDQTTYLATQAERAFLKAVNGGCHLPLGAYLESHSGTFKFHYLFGDDLCKNIIKGVYEFDIAPEQVNIEAIVLEVAAQCARIALEKIKK